MSSAEARRLRLARLAVAAAALLAWCGALRSTAWVRDDRALILENPLLRAGAAWPLLSTGYHQASLGEQAPIHQWRPALSLSFLVQARLHGLRPEPLRAANLLLHALAALLLLEALRRRMAPGAALAGALAWAVLPAHAESVLYLTSRSELLAAVSVLGAWLLLGAPARPGPGRLAAGALVYLLGALSKEHALLFPFFLALADRCFAGASPWSPERRRVHLALGGAALLVLLGRAALLPAVAHGGDAYFAGVSPLVRLLTLASFWLRGYLLPLLTAGAPCFDLSRPGFPDASPSDAGAWLALLLLAAGAAAAARALARRRPWGFWALGPALFLLPTSHLLMDLDTLGASRFLYLPSMGLAALAGLAFEAGRRRSPRAAAAAGLAVLLLLLRGAAAQAALWKDETTFYRAVHACNPRSPAVNGALGLALLREGRAAEARESLETAAALGDGRAPYNLALLARESGDRAGAER